jgi:hypothetical protein
VTQDKAAQHKKYVNGKVSFIEHPGELLRMEAEVNNRVVEANYPNRRYSSQWRQRLDLFRLQ